MTIGTDERQEAIDRFYFERGPCCAGCDHWRSFNSRSGECAKAAPISGDQRMAMLGMEGCSLKLGAGFPFTTRENVCGDFKDEFDWNTLPLGYRARIGQTTRTRTASSREGS